MAIPRPASNNLAEYTTPAMIARLLSPVSQDRIILTLEQLRSVISSAGPDEPIKFWHASISDYLLDKTRSKQFFVDIRMAHEALARGYLRMFQNQPSSRFLDSPFFTLFLKHYKCGFLSESLHKDLVGYDLFSAHKAAVGDPSHFSCYALPGNQKGYQNSFVCSYVHSSRA